MVKKKIRYPLEMSDGTQVRSLEELKEHFDLEAVLGYYKSGKLLPWLNDRYLEDEAEAVSALDENAPDFQKQLCAVFGVEFQGEEMDLEEIELRQERLKRLRQFTDEEAYIEHIDQVVFDQDDLLDLLDEGVETIYLCGEKFSVPASQKGKTYIGINQPEVKISGKYTLDDLGIQFENCSVAQLPKESGTKPAAAQRQKETVSSGPTEISDELAGEIFDAIFEEGDGVAAREIIVETDHYYIVEEELEPPQSEGDDNDFFVLQDAPRYRRFQKSNCTWKELPNLSHFSLASKYYKNESVITRRSITYTTGDVLYMQDISDNNKPSIWKFDLNSEVLEKIGDGIRFLCPNLRTSTISFDGQYLPVLKGTKLCVLDLNNKELIKVRNRGQWIDNPIDAVISKKQVLLFLRSTQLGGDSDSHYVLYSFNIADGKFQTLSWPGDKEIIIRDDKFYNFPSLLYTETGVLELGIGCDMSYIDTSSYPPTITLIELKSRNNHSRIWKNRIFWVGDQESHIYMLDTKTKEQVEVINDDGEDYSRQKIFACIGNTLYMHSNLFALHKSIKGLFYMANMMNSLLGSVKASNGYRIFLQEPFEKFPLRLNPLTKGTEDRYSWREDDDED